MSSPPREGNGRARVAKMDEEGEGVKGGRAVNGEVTATFCVSLFFVEDGTVGSKVRDEDSRSGFAIEAGLLDNAGTGDLEAH